VADLDAAEAALEAYETGQRELAAARSEVAVLAPEGTERLEREVAALEQEIALAGCSGEDASRIGEASQPEHHRDELALLTSALREKRRAIDERRSVRDALRLEVGGLDSEIGHREQRHAALAEELPLPEARGQLIERLAQERDQLQGRLGEAVRDADVWRTKAPDDAAFAGMEQQIAEHEARRRREGEELNDLRVQISALEGRMAELREIDLKTRVEELGAALQRAEDRVGDLEQEVAALVLIEREIAAAEESLQERVLVPLMDRLGPLVERVLDGASLELAGPLEVAKIRRGQQVAPASDLSDGTREQIAVMVRLAYARMFADLGVAMPLILDDALVFSDDDRLEAMFAMLAEAAAAHQVIVLTCHDRAFRPLIDRHGAKGLGFAPWDSVALPIAG
jgi:DNA repair exonuclease SbcCD ATPase subunit